VAKSSKGDSTEGSRKGSSTRSKKTVRAKKPAARKAAAEPERVQVARGDESFEFSTQLPVLPLRDVVIFPYMTMPLLVGRPASVRAIERAVAGDRVVFVLSQKNSEVSDPKPEDLYSTGTAVRVLQLFRLPDGTLRVLVEGLVRGHVTNLEWLGDSFRASVSYLPETFDQVVYMRDWPVLPGDAVVLAEDQQGRPAVWQIANNAYGFSGNPGIKLGMVEDLIMEFEEVPADSATQLEQLRTLQPVLEDQLVPIMTGLVQCTSLMSSPKAAADLDAQVI
jgi:hypothetical protein